MFGDWDDFNEDDDTQDVLKRYHNMVIQHSCEFFDLEEFECIIDYFADQCSFTDAFVAIGHALRQYPNATSVKLKYVQLLIDKGKPGKALSIIKSLVNTESDNYRFHLAKGLALNLTGKQDEACTSFEKALRLCNEGKDEVAYSIAQSFMQNGLHDVASKYLHLAYQCNHSNILVLYDLGLNYEKLDNLEKSIHFYSKYIDIDPFAEHVWNNLGMLHSNLNDLHRATESFDYAIAINPLFLPAYFCKADMFLQAGQVQQSIDVYMDLLAEDAGNTDALCCLGNCYEYLDDHQQALLTFKFALEISENCSDAWYGSGMVYFKLKQYNKCFTSIKKAIAIEAENSQYWVLLGDFYSRTRKLNKAVASYTRACELNPSDGEARLAWAQVLFRKKRIVEAIGILNQLLLDIPDSSAIYYRLAAYHVYQQDITEAQRCFKKGLLLNFAGHTEMFRLFPKTKSLPVFRVMIENHLGQHKNYNQSRKLPET